MCEVDDSVADRKPAALPAALQCLWCWRQLSRCVGQDEVAAVRSPQLLASQEEWPGEDMSAATELLWPGAALLLLLGAAAGLCVRCSRPGAKKSEKIYEQRSLQENQQSFSVARTYSLVGQSWPAALVDTASDVTPRKDKLLRFSPSTEDSASPRYQNFSKGSRHGSDAVYIDPITMDYYNWGQFQKPLEGDDDDNSYENVLLCKQKSPESGDEGSEDYQNSASIHQWQESRKVLEQVPREAPPSRAGSSDEDSGEPDYVNEGVVALEA
ncbi:linker for activation of T-cells family member 2 isoform X1 [Manis pentadactyla]|uniref:linker for activation of T-cells family member 2 isoform X1 n=1 Tax=Manis pentadactyla TaxID=143292 RepID=UPI0018754E62|nr:linker for activation of T-cells family member 2 isoform X1 [Manis pentadactyla]